MFSNYAYYIFGDIFSYFAILVPVKSIENVYNILVLVRIYFVGISFLCYAKYKNISKLPAVIGAILYTFSTFTLFWGVRHPYFINALILLPLAFIGIEKVILENKFGFYIFIIFLSYLSTFYFAYMISIGICIYGVILAIYHYKSEGTKTVIKVLGKTLLYSIIGIFLAGIFLVPTLFSFVNSERSLAGSVYTYTLDYYRSVISNLLTVNGPRWGMSAIILITIPAFFRRRKENYPLFLTMLVLFVPLFIPEISSIFNGFKYPSMRWLFLLIFIFAFASMTFLNSSEKLDAKDVRNIIIFVLLYLGLNSFLENNIKYFTSFQLFAAVLMGFILIKEDCFRKWFPKIQLRNILILIIVVFSTKSLIYALYIERNYVSEFVTNDLLRENYNTSMGSISDFNKALNYIKKNDRDFYRISKYPYKYNNVSIPEKFNAIGHYYSITPKVYSGLNYDLKNVDYYTNQGFREFNYRTKINTILGNKYLIVNKNRAIPYGYVKTDYKGKSKVYQNKYALPFAVFYDSYINTYDYDNFNALEKESSLLKAVTLEIRDIPNNLSYKKDLNFSNIKNISYTIKDVNKIMSLDGELEIKSASKNYLNIEIPSVTGEVYVSFKNLRYNTYSKEEMIENKIKKDYTLGEIKNTLHKYKWYQVDDGYKFTLQLGNTIVTRDNSGSSSAYYMNMTDFLVNLGYYDKIKGNIKLSFNKTGYYTFDEIEVYTVVMDDYLEDVTNLQKSNFQVLDYGNGI